MHTPSSMKKLSPINPKITPSTVLPSVIKLFKKKAITPKMNTPVFAIGLKTDEIATANVVFLDFNALNTRPGRTPAITPFKRTVKIVPGTEIAKKGDASPDTRTAIPKTSPSHAPPFTPKIAAPITIVTKDRVIENVPVLMDMLRYCKMKVKAVKIPYITNDLVDVDVFVFFIKITSYCCFQNGIQR